MSTNISKGQQMILMAFQKIIDAAPDGIHRVVVIPLNEAPLACHVGKKYGDFLADGAMWASFSMVCGDVLDRELEVRVAVQTFLDEDPEEYGDLDESGSKQLITGWAVNQEGGMVQLRRKDLLDIFPYRSDIGTIYQGR